MSILNVKILHKPFRNKVLTVVRLEIFDFSLALCKPVRLLRRSQPGGGLSVLCWAIYTVNSASGRSNQVCLAAAKRLRSVAR